MPHWHNVPHINQVAALDDELLWLVHRARASYSPGETLKRLRETQACNYRDALVLPLRATATRQSPTINTSEQAALDEFPAHGIEIGHWANGLIFSPTLVRLPRRTHKAYVGLVRLGLLGIATGRTEAGKETELLVQLKPSLRAMVDADPA